MGVVLAMEGVVMKWFFHQNNKLGILLIFALAGFLQIAAVLMGGCQNTRSDIPTFRAPIDVTEDLHHRLKAGLFQPEKDPVICHIKKKRNIYTKLRLPFYTEEAPHTMVRIHWERGSFWVYSNDRAHLIFYMDAEVTFSHVQVSTPEGFGNTREFWVRNTYPGR